MKFIILSTLILTAITTQTVSASPLLNEIALPRPLTVVDKLTIDALPANATLLPDLEDVKGGFMQRGRSMCETSKGSPPTADLWHVSNRLRKFPKYWRCRVTNSGGSHCTQMNDWGGAATSCCGKLFASASCHDAAWAIDQIVANCADNGRAGGQWIFDSSYKVVIHVP